MENKRKQIEKSNTKNTLVAYSPGYLRLFKLTAINKFKISQKLYKPQNKKFIFFQLFNTTNNFAPQFFLEQS